MRRNSGFSLLELSIVLVIIGLLASGVMVGQSLVRGAEIRSVITDLNKISTATNAFRLKYNALPGDMKNATAYWGVRAAGTDVVCHQTINTTTGTCNGDGNGIIDYIAGDSATFGERFLAWQHLSRAGLIEGNFTGASGSTTSLLAVPETNVASSKITSSFFSFGYLYGPYSGDVNVFDGSYNRNLIALYTTSAPPLKPEEAWNIDTKLDDGRPATGIVFTWKNTSVWGPGCATTDVVSTAAYALTSNSNLCLISFKL
ncbi:MAG: type II secretion system GspH family protein [Rickettsiales bacterium]|nr:type II secretion system GspH family protein [Rickettsiales bacterium]